MSEFNLIDEPWISVVTDYKGNTKLAIMYSNSYPLLRPCGEVSYY